MENERQISFGAPTRDENGQLRSMAAPAMAKKRMTATQNMLRAIPNNNVKAFRQLALQAGAELTGVRAYDRTGKNPATLVESCENFLPHEKDAFRKQLRELPQLLRGADHARSQAMTIQVSGSPGFARSKSQTTIRTEDDEPDDRTRKIMSKSSSAMLPTAKALDSPILSAKTIRGFEMKQRGAMGSLAMTIGHSETGIKAAFKNPALLKKDTTSVAGALPAMTMTLRSQEFAIRAAIKNPKLMHVDGAKFKKVVPVLNVIMGSEEEAGYCIATRPELLEVDRAQQFKDTVQTLAECVCSMNDGVWLVVQSFVPPSIRLSGQQCHHEALQGEYMRMKGVRFDSRPVWRKPASKMAAQFGPKARDLFILYSNHGPEGKDKGCWTVTAAFDAAKASRPSKAKTEGDYAREVLGKADCHGNSPDQVALGTWQFPQEETKSTIAKEGWHYDDYVKTADVGRRRGPPLLLTPPPLVRRSYDLLQEALGVCWRKALDDGTSMLGSKFVGCPRKGDRIHSGEPGDVGTITFQDMGDYCLKKNYTFFRLPADGSTSELSLQAWEPMLVYLLYIGNPAEQAVQEEEPPPEAAAPAKGKGKPDPKAEAGAAEAAAAAAAEAALKSHRPRLEKDGWWEVDPATVKKPELRKELDGAPAHTEVVEIFVRCYFKGRCEVPVLSNQQGPPMVFVRPMLSAISQRAQRPCQIVKAKPGEPIYFVTQEDLKPKEESVKEEPVAAKGKKGAPAEPPPEETEPVKEGPIHPVLKGVGDLGYTGYQLFRAPAADRHCDPCDSHLRIETEDRIKVVLAFCRLPPKLSKTEEPAADQEYKMDEPVTKAIPPPPPLPAWLDKDGWKVYEPKLPVTLVAENGELVTCDRYRSKEIKKGDRLPVAINIKGAGPDLTCLAFWLQTGPNRPNPLKQFLFEEPCLLSAADHTSYLWRRLRVELGEDIAHQALTNLDLQPEWAHICQSGTEEELEEWIYKRKLEVFGGFGRPGGNASGIEKAKMLIERCPELADVTAPLYMERCRALTSGLGSVRYMLDVLNRRPDLLAGDAGLFPHSLEVLQGVFQSAASQAVALKNPELLTRGKQMEALFGRAKEHFPHYAERLSERKSGEWALWKKFVDERPDAISKWLGRIAAEERTLTCQDRVKSFGKQVDVATAMSATV